MPERELTCARISGMFSPMIVKPFINVLGGPKAVAEAVNALADLHESDRALKPKSVSQWGCENTIPHRWRLYVAKLAKKKKIKEVPPEIRSFMN